MSSAHQNPTGHPVTVANRPGTLCESFLLVHGRPSRKASAVYLRFRGPGDHYCP